MVSFSGSGRCGRNSRPSNRFISKKPTPVTRKITRKTTRSVIRRPLASTGRVPLAQSAAPGVAGIHLVPVAQLGLAVLPAQVDLAAVEPTREVDQPQLAALQ